MGDNQILEWHLVAFLDVVGQREKLLQLRLPRTPEEYLAVRAILKGTVGVVLALRQSFRKQFESFERGFLDNHPELRKGVCLPDFLPFSDAFVTSLTLRNETGDERITVLRLISALAAAGFVMLTTLASKHALRGGIDIGAGVRLPTGEPYGRALASAHLLESEIAQYPRIVIGDELWKYLSLGVSETTLISAPLHALMSVATELTMLDADGTRILDYLGPGIAKLIPVSKAKDLVKRAYDGVIHQKEHWLSKGHTQRSERYAKTRRYFESRLFVWDLLIAK